MAVGTVGVPAGRRHAFVGCDDPHTKSASPSPPPRISQERLRRGWSGTMCATPCAAHLAMGTSTRQRRGRSRILPLYPMWVTGSVTPLSGAHTSVCLTAWCDRCPLRASRPHRDLMPILLTGVVQVARRVARHRRCGWLSERTVSFVDFFSVLLHRSKLDDIRIASRAMSATSATNEWAVQTGMLSDRTRSD